MTPPPPPVLYGNIQLDIFKPAFSLTRLNFLVNIGNMIGDLVPSKYEPAAEIAKFHRLHMHSGQEKVELIG